jgi:hypothetical protein
MICLVCDNETFSPSVGKVRQLYKNEDFMVETSIMVCDKCGWTTVGVGQIDDLLKNTRETYENLRLKKD